MGRRHFTLLTGGALTASLWSWLTADPAAAGQIIHGRRVGESAVTHIEDRVRQLRRDDDLDNGEQLLTEADASLGMVVGLLKRRSYTDDHGARLHAAAADPARIKAWAAFDAEDECDDATFLAALHSARSSNDIVLGSHILAFGPSPRTTAGGPPTPRP
ncbi:hypothetical protein [Streptomyces melanogenes]|uniref:hypothetical protein n=1 Tax=Streptomyces melanogenes TaxID=67326 RepID=UPI00379C12BC